MHYNYIVDRLNFEEKDIFTIERNRLVKGKTIYEMSLDTASTYALSVSKNINIKDFILNNDLECQTHDKIQRILLNKILKQETKINKINQIILES